jgi:hypothetical protein
MTIPESIPDFLAADHLARPAGQQRQKLKVLSLEPDQGSTLAQVAACKVQFEGAEAQYPSLLPAPSHEECLRGTLYSSRAGD